MMDDEVGPRMEPTGFSTHSVFDFSDPESVKRADPSALLSFEVLKLMIREGGPILPGQIREVESTGTIVMNGVKYETRMVFQTSRQLTEPPKTPVIPPEDLDVYRRRDQ